MSSLTAFYQGYQFSFFWVLLFCAGCLWNGILGALLVPVRSQTRRLKVDAAMALTFSTFFSPWESRWLRAVKNKLDSFLHQFWRYPGHRMTFSERDCWFDSCSWSSYSTKDYCLPLTKAALRRSTPVTPFTLASWQPSRWLLLLDMQAVGVILVISLPDRSGVDRYLLVKSNWWCGGFDTDCRYLGVYLIIVLDLH